jgi:hypothetical protein
MFYLVLSNDGLVRRIKNIQELAEYGLHCHGQHITVPGHILCEVETRESLRITFHHWKLDPASANTSTITYYPGRHTGGQSPLESGDPCRQINLKEVPSFWPEGTASLIEAILAIENFLTSYLGLGNDYTPQLIQWLGLRDVEGILFAVQTD